MRTFNDYGRLNLLLKQKTIRLNLLIILVFTMILSSCSGWKNLAKTQKSTPEYDFLGDVQNGWSLVRKDSLYGYVSANGRKQVKPIFSWADDFSAGMALVKHKDAYSFINSKGQLSRRIKVQKGYAFSEGLAAIQIGNKWGYVDVEGKVIIKPQFDWAMPFQENLAAVSIGLKKGYINKEGELIIPVVYDEAYAFKNGVARIKQEKRYGLIDTLGTLILPAKYYKIEEWENDFYRLSVLNEVKGLVDKYGLATATGQLLFEPIYSAIDYTSQHHIRLKKDTLTGLFDTTGKEIIPIDYSFLGYVSDEGFIAAEKNRKWGFINLQGEVVLPFEYEETRMGFSQGRTWVKKEGKQVLMDANFQIIETAHDYDHVFYFRNDYALVGKKEGMYTSLYGHIDRNGKEIIPLTYNTAESFNSNGTAIVGTGENGIFKRFLITNQNEILPFEQTFYRLTYLNEQVMYNDNSQKYTFLSTKTGQELLDIPYKLLEPLKYSDRKDLAKVYLNGKAGLIDTTFTEILPAVYDNIYSLKAGRLPLKKDGLLGFADEQFRIRIPFQYDEQKFENGLLEVGRNKIFGVIDLKGQTIVPLQYKKVTVDNISHRIYADKESSYDVYDWEGRFLFSNDFEYFGGYWGKSYTLFRQNGQLGVMDFYFNILVEPQYDNIGRFYDDLAWVVKDKKGGFINTDFQVVIPIVYDDLEEYVLGFTKVKKDGKVLYLNTKGEVSTPTEEEIQQREEELQRRKDGFFNFSS